MRWLLLITAVGSFFGVDTVGSLDVERLRSEFEHVTSAQGLWSHFAFGTGANNPKFLTAPVQLGTMSETIVATGALRPVETVDVGSQIAGEVTELMVDFNDDVHRGQPLAQLDRRSYEARLAEQQAALAAAQADRRIAAAKVERVLLDRDVAKSNQPVVAAKLESARQVGLVARENYQRQAQLRVREAVTARAFDAATVELSSTNTVQREAEAAVAGQKIAQEVADVAIREAAAELAKADAEITRHAALVAAAAADLDRTLIRSPIDGVVVGRFISRGQTLTENIENHPIFSIAHRLDEMEVHARIDETDIGRIRVGQPASFAVDAYPGRTFAGVVRQIRKAPEVQQNVVTYTVIVTADNRDGFLLPGMTALAKLVVSSQPDALKVPVAALSYAPPAGLAGSASKSAGSGSGVWIVAGDGQTLHRVSVEPISSDADTVAVRGEALKSNDRVVVGEATDGRGRNLFGMRF